MDSVQKEFVGILSNIALMEEVGILKRWIIISSIIAAIILVGSPFLIYFGVKSNVQWIGFFASYLGGIFGGIVSGGLTLGGVYLTIRHQKELLKQDRAEKIRYVYRKLNGQFRKLIAEVNNDRQWLPHDQAENIRQSARSLLSTIEANMDVIHSDFMFFVTADKIIKKLEDLLAYDYSRKSNELVVEEYTNITIDIREEFKNLNKNNRRKH